MSLECFPFQALDIMVFGTYDFLKRRKLRSLHQSKVRSKGVQASEGDVVGFTKGILNLPRGKDIRQFDMRLTQSKESGM